MLVASAPPFAWGARSGEQLLQTNGGRRQGQPNETLAAPCPETVQTPVQRGNLPAYRLHPKTHPSLQHGTGLLQISMATTLPPIYSNLTGQRITAPLLLPYLYWLGGHGGATMGVLWRCFGGFDLLSLQRLKKPPYARLGNLEDWKPHRQRQPKLTCCSTRRSKSRKTVDPSSVSPSMHSKEEHGLTLSLTS